MDEDKNAILENYYFNAGNPAAFSGPQKLYKVLSKKYPGLFGLGYIKKWLNNQDSYSIQRQVRHRFKTPNVRVSGIDEQFQADLADVSNLSKDNSGTNYLLFVIDVFSKYLWVLPLKDKTAKSVIEGMSIVFNERKPKKLQTDKGSEFVNRWFKKFMTENNVYFFTTQNVAKASVVERSQRTLKGMMYRMMRQKRSYRYIDYLDQIVASYNASPHRSLHYLAPKQVSKINEANVWASLYLKTTPKSKRKSKHVNKSFAKFKKGQLVRVSFQKRPFVKSYDDQFSTEVFKIFSSKFIQGIPMYALQDLQGDKIKGHFYNSELLAIDKDADNLWFIEKVLKQRRRGGKLQYFVKWDGFPKKFNSWIDSDSVIDKSDRGA